MCIIQVEEKHIILAFCVLLLSVTINANYPKLKLILELLVQRKGNQTNIKTKGLFNLGDNALIL